MTRTTALFSLACYAVGLVGVAWELLIAIDPASVNRGYMVGLFIVGAFFGVFLHFIPEMLNALRDPTSEDKD